MKRKPEDENNSDQSARLGVNFSIPPPNIQGQIPMLPMQPDGGYYMNTIAMNGPAWRGRGGSPRGAQNYGYNNLGSPPNVWRPPRGLGPNNSNKRNFRGGNYYRNSGSANCGGQKQSNQYNNQQNFFGNQEFSGPNSYSNGPFPNVNYGNQNQWPLDVGYPSPEDNTMNIDSPSGSAINKGQGSQTPSSTCSVEGVEQDLTEDFVSSKSKRRSMSQSYPSRPWDREAAEKAYAVEMEFSKVLRNQNLIIRFPDPDLNKDIVKAFHPQIINVHFQVPSGPRFCFVQLDEGADVDKVIKSLTGRPFGAGTLHVEKRSNKDEDNLTPESIDPFTLYIGNLPSTIAVSTVREKFPTASRVDVGYAQRMKYTRYAFIRYNSAEEALEAFKECHNLQLENRSVIVRFRRQRGPGGGSQNPSKKSKVDDAAANPKHANDATEDESLASSKQKKKTNTDIDAAATVPVVTIKQEANVATNAEEMQTLAVASTSGAVVSDSVVVESEPVETATAPADDIDSDDDEESDDDADEEEEEEEESENDDEEEEEEVDEDDDDDDDDDEEEEEEDDDDDEDDDATTHVVLRPEINGDDDDDDDEEEEVDDEESEGDYE